MKTLDIASADSAARSSPSLDFGAVAPAPAAEPHIARWPGWARVMILVGGAAGLWGVIGLIALKFG